MEFHNALKDYDNTYYAWFKLICETIRVVGMVVYNSAFGRKRSDKLRKPTQLVRFGWEKPKLQTVEEMKEVILGIGHMKGVKITQHGKPVKFEES